MSSSSESDVPHRTQVLFEAAEPLLLNTFDENSTAENRPFSIQHKLSDISSKNLRYTFIKSQRVFENVDADIERNIHITCSTRNYMYTKLSELIEHEISYKIINNAHYNKEDQESYVKLLRKAKDFIETKDLVDSGLFTRKSRVGNIYNAKFDTQEEESKIMRSVTVSSEDIINPKDIKFWAPRKQRKIFYYILERDGILHSMDIKNKS